ncbi:MAG: 2-oxoacid:acceptor oxidoreductase subunit alpha [Clostridiales bacterium]|nr:2-oxoacid:acceptor oxidoreductase subunit alpha [Clostridiales bacterium]
MNKPRLVQGNEACALGAVAAGATFYAGYPITPSTEIAEHISVIFPKLGRKFIQMEDEIASMGAILGASCAGVKAFTATSGPGFSLMQELIGYAAMTELPAVVINVMRPGPSTGLPTLSASGDVQQARWGTHGDHSIIALCASSVTECYHQTIRAFNLAEKFLAPVLLLIEEEIGHLREKFEIDENHSPELVERALAHDDEENFLPYADAGEGVPLFAPFGSGHRHHVTGLTHNEKGFYTSNPQIVERAIRRLHDKIEFAVDEIAEFEKIHMEDAQIVVFAYGSVARSAEEAVHCLRAKGIKAGLLKPLVLWPFADSQVTMALLGKKCVVVPETNLGQMCREIKRVAPCGVTVYPLNQVDGHLITPEKIVAKVEEVCK